MAGKPQRYFDVIHPVDIGGSVYPDVGIADPEVTVGTNVQLAGEKRILFIAWHEADLDELASRRAYRVGNVKSVKEWGSFGKGAKKRPVQDNNVARINIHVVVQKLDIGLDVFVVDVTLVQFGLFGGYRHALAASRDQPLVLPRHVFLEKNRQ